MVAGTMSCRTECPPATTESCGCVQEYAPLVDIIENPEEWMLVADLPGATAENIAIDFERGTLSLHAPVRQRRDVSKGDDLLTEYGVGDYRCSFQIGEGVDANRMSAEFKNGVLTLRLPKAEAAKARKITVRTA